MSNIFYDAPEKNGLGRLVHVYDIELDDEPYQFSTVRVVFDPEENVFYSVYDSGCSCPAPFENVTTWGDLGEKIRTVGGLQVRLMRETRNAPAGVTVREQVLRAVSVAKNLLPDTKCYDDAALVATLDIMDSGVGESVATTLLEKYLGGS